MIVIAIDPGPKESALVVWNGSAVEANQFLPNDEIILYLGRWYKTPLVIEMIACYGMAVGVETFETCVWIGRFMQEYGPNKCHRLTRGEIKMHLCHSMRAKDANSRQALIDRFGPTGTKKNPGPLYGISSHLWAALAIAVTWMDQPQAKVEKFLYVDPLPGVENKALDAMLERRAQSESSEFESGGRRRDEPTAQADMDNSIIGTVTN